MGAGDQRFRWQIVWLHPLILFKMAAILPTTALQKINLMTAQAWTPNQNEVETTQINAASLEKQISVQKQLGASFVKGVKDPKKDYDVEVFWTDFCNNTVQDCDNDNYCGDLDADEAEVQSEDYKIQQCLVDKFAVSETTFAGSFMDLEQFILDNQNSKIRNLINKANQKFLLFLHANAGYNRGGYFTYNGENQSELPADQVENLKIITRMILDGQMSNMPDTYMISGYPELIATYMEANFDQANDNGKGMAARAGFFPFTPDLLSFANTPAVQNSTFLLTPYAVAAVNKNYYGSTVPTYDADLKKYKYYIPLTRFGWYIDVLHQRICENAKKDRWKHVFQYTLHYDFFLNPKGCADGEGRQVTGILEYVPAAVEVEP